MSNKSIELKREIEHNDRSADRSKRTSLKRSLNILEKRSLRWGFQKWADKNRLNKDKEDKGQYVLKYLRKNRCRQAWVMYVNAVR